MHELDAAAGVGRTVAQQTSAHAVRDARRDSPQPRVLPRDAIANHQLERCVAFSERLQERRNVDGIVLTIAVKRRDPVRVRS